ncbi:hypothetical protein NC653_040733 [Populus alba x Populus x berolinensis]|uniref:Uncharacterized protein n=1 Tax=Populus alba x Populus x berolinensis TaxID=444605 RepID=A0AAD6L6U1_9ROSI|nr:hypothetical protein NC653_040733 [Populus alba x Populus x berolinensis]
MNGKLMKIFKLTQGLVLPDPMVTLPDQLLEPPHKRLEPSLPLLEQLDPLLVEVDLDPLLLLCCWSFLRLEPSLPLLEQLNPLLVEVELDPLLLLRCWRQADHLITSLPFSSSSLSLQEATVQNTLLCCCI